MSMKAQRARRRKPRGSPGRDLAGRLPPWRRRPGRTCPAAGVTRGGCRTDSAIHTRSRSERPRSEAVRSQAMPSARQMARPRRRRGSTRRPRGASRPRLTTMYQSQPSADPRSGSKRSSRSRAGDHGLLGKALGVGSRRRPRPRTGARDPRAPRRTPLARRRRWPPCPGDARGPRQVPGPAHPHGPTSVGARPGGGRHLGVRHRSPVAAAAPRPRRDAAIPARDGQRSLRRAGRSAPAGRRDGRGRCGRSPGPRTPRAGGSRGRCG
jgi:hypothetical protein